MPFYIVQEAKSDGLKALALISKASAKLEPDFETTFRTKLVSVVQLRVLFSKKFVFLWWILLSGEFQVSTELKW